MKKLLRFSVFFLCLCLMLSSIAFAEETESFDAKEFVEAIADTVRIYSRYEETDKESLYKAALESLLDYDPTLLDKALSGMLSSVDEHSFYYTEEEKRKLYDSITDEITGIGVTVLTRDGKLIVSQPVPGSPADRAGIKVGDIIISADGVELSGMDTDSAIEHIRGEKGKNCYKSC